MSLKRHTLRVARPTDHLEEVARMYCDGLGFEMLLHFEGHDRFDGVILGHSQAPYHLEFVSERGHDAGRAPSPEHLLVFYISDETEWLASCERMASAGFKAVEPNNPYWAERGRTFEDIDGYHVVLENDAWTK